MRPTDNSRDQGTILIITLAITVVLGAIVASVTSYATTSLRYGKVVESRADRLAAADGGTRYAIGRLNAGAGRLCATGSPDIIEAPTLNDATVTVTCRVVGPGFDYTNGWAMILTGEEIPPASDPACSPGSDNDPCALLKSGSGVSVEKLIGGPVYMADASFGLQSPVELQRAQLFYTSSDCSVPPTIPADLTFDESSLGVTCTNKPWSRQPENWSAADASTGLFHEPNRASMPTDLNPEPIVINDGTACKVFLPGHYTTPPVLGRRITSCRAITCSTGSPSNSRRRRSRSGGLRPRARPVTPSSCRTRPATTSGRPTTATTSAVPMSPRRAHGQRGRRNDLPAERRPLRRRRQLDDGDPVAASRAATM